MAISFSSYVENNILYIKSDGMDESLEQAQQYALDVITEAVKADVSKILCDETYLRYNLEPMDTNELANFISKNVPRVGKAAIVCNPKQIKDAAFWENEAVSRGLKVRVFSDVEMAKKWIEK